MKLTAWFPGSVQPARPGVYKRSMPFHCRRFTVYCLWDGKDWHFHGGNVSEAAATKTISFRQTVDPWRGLAQEPNP